MKNTVLLILIFPFIAISCTNDGNVDDLSTNKKVNFKKPKMILQGPENDANPYDSIGRLHNEVLEIYLAANSGSITIEDIMVQIQSIGLSNTFNIVQDCSAPTSINIINTILSDPLNNGDTIIENSVLSPQAKTKIKIFLNSLAMIQSNPYDDIYESITTYESEIISNHLLNNVDKRVMLTTASIARYSIYYEKKKDRDWDSSYGNHIGGIIGALDPSLSPVIMALVIGLAQNNLVIN
ncbi:MULTISPECIES: hypothetical protein [unclassified Flavobacterium]|uniref:hypothetical protein n=1 Tax=unclassified Flavobacterium TaxID=196869 RepID=UPI00057E61D9|nr:MULTISPECIES: hypothetical protein [unclassified Flavobacterium]KIA95603.1 hypothetical protein OA93_17770 [Flavobacterium sp. KMS]OUL62599.1 hypothetical protein B8T70_09120 [Flavobacterium sp. AJR]